MVHNQISHLYRLALTAFRSELIPMKNDQLHKKSKCQQTLERAHTKIVCNSKFDLPARPINKFRSALIESIRLVSVLRFDLADWQCQLGIKH